MPSTIHIIPARDFVVSSANVEFDLEKTREFLRKTLQSAHLSKQSHIILDVRKGSTAMRAFEVFQLVGVLEDLEPPFTGKLAFLNDPKDSFDRAEFFSKCARYRGFQVEAFQDFEEAVIWLYPPVPAVVQTDEQSPNE